MYKTKVSKKEKQRVHSTKMMESTRTLMRQGGKFCHGTRGKPGHSSHGDKYF